MTSREFEHIALGVRPQLMQIAMRFCRDEDDAEDIVQEVMLRLWIRREELGHNVTSLACKATRNLCVSWWRKKQVKRIVPLVDDMLVDESTPVDKQLIVNEQMEQLQQCIEQLTRSQQRLIKLMLFDGLNVQEIATITGLTPRSVSSILSTAKRKMMEAMK